MPLVFARSILGFAVADTGVTWTDPDLNNASYDSKSFYLGGQEANPQGLAFSSDGTKMYIAGETSDAVYQYSLSTAWDVSTASYDSVSFDPTSQGAQPYCIRFKPDGTSLFILQNSADSIFQYTLSTAWDLSTASYASKSFSVSSQDNNPIGISFANSGTKLYMIGNTTDTVYEYTLSTAWDISTASYANNSFSTATQDTAMFSLFVFEDGTKMFTGGFGTDAIYQYSLSTSYDISTASYDSVSFSVSSQLPNLFDITFKPDGSKMYVVGTSNDRVYQYSTVASAWTDPDIANASYDSVSFDVSSQDSSPNGLTFGDSGTKLYVAGKTNNTVFQYTLTSAYDISTASYASKSFSVSSEESSLRTVRFSPNGGSMYILGNTNRVVYQYTLSTNWDVSTASYASKSMSAATQSTFATGFVFNDDGTKIFVNSPADDRVYEYLLTTAYDVSTGSYNNASVLLTGAVSNINPGEAVFNDDGTKMYVSCIVNDRIYEFGLTTAFDISTASYSSINFSTASEGTQPMDLEFNSSGSKMFVVDASNTSIYQYST